MSYHTRGGVFGKTISLLLLPISKWPFYPLCEGTLQLVFRSSSERIILYAAIDLLCQREKESSGSSYALFLNLILD